MKVNLTKQKHPKLIITLPISFAFPFWQYLRLDCVAVRLAGRGMDPTDLRFTAPALAVNSPPRPLAARRLLARHRSWSHGAFNLRIVAVEQANELSCLGASALTDHDNVHAASQKVAAKAARPEERKEQYS